VSAAGEELGGRRASDRSTNAPGAREGAGHGASQIARAAEFLAEARGVVILTGAGVSAESGVPTFRGEEGLWRNHRPEELATPGAFRRDPALVWEWYQWRRDLIQSCEPNRAHRAIARLQRKRDDVTLVTQNVDGLHPLAGSPRARLLEVHGSIFRMRCTRCAWEDERRAPVDASSRDTLPRCPSCDALARPAVVWFGESLDEGVLGRAFEVAGESDVCLVVGTSAVVQPAASIPRVTAERGGTLVEVNPDRTPLSSAADVRLAGPAGELMPRLVELALG